MREIQRLFLYIALVSVGFILWTEWKKEYIKQPTPTSQTQTEFSEQPSSSSYPKTIPNLSSSSSTVKIEDSNAISISSSKENIVSVTTDVLSVKIDLVEGRIIESQLLKYPKSLENKEPYILFNSEPTQLYFGEFELNERWDFPKDQRPTYTTQKLQYQLDKKQDELTVNLEWKHQGLTVVKSYLFKRNQYLVDVSTKITNQEQKTWVGKIYYQLLRKQPKQDDSLLFGMTSYIGASLSDPDKKLYEKVPFSSMKKNPINRTVRGGWVAMQEHYFLTAWIPKTETHHHFYSQVFGGELYAIGFSTLDQTIQPGKSQVIESRLYIGPEIAEQLKAIAPGLELTIDYGWLWFISSFLFSLLKHIQRYIGNWGWAIILLTLSIKIVFYKLSATSYRSMANLRKFQPRIQALKERYGDDRQKFSQALMEIYKKEKINPLSGCLPIIIQIPVFIALYWVLLESVELRQAPFVGWIQDLSSKDPYYVLPILMGATMFLQQKMSPPPPDPTQAKVMMFLPLFFTFLFLSVPSGLVLYWTVNNLLSILQQWYITYSFEKKSQKKLK